MEVNRFLKTVPNAAKMGKKILWQKRNARFTKYAIPSPKRWIS